MKGYLAVKYYENGKNKEFIESLIKSVSLSGIDLIVMARDYEKYGEVHFQPSELMDLTFKVIDESEILIVELSEKGVGIGIEAGYAYAKGIPIILIAKKGADVSATMKGIAKEVFIYNNFDELGEFFEKVKNQNV